MTFSHTILHLLLSLLHNVGEVYCYNSYSSNLFFKQKHDAVLSIKNTEKKYLENIVSYLAILKYDRNVIFSPVL